MVGDARPARIPAVMVTALTGLTWNLLLFILIPWLYSHLYSQCRINTELLDAER